MHNHALKKMPSTIFFRTRTKHITIKTVFYEKKGGSKPSKGKISRMDVCLAANMQILHMKFVIYK